jgi:hypothetical protein
MMGILLLGGDNQGLFPKLPPPVSGEALRKKTRFNRGEIRLRPKNGFCFLISTILLRARPGKFLLFLREHPRLP